MFSPKFFCLALVYTVYSNSLIHGGESAPSYSNHACTNSTTGDLTRNSTYFSNLNLLLSYLTSNSTTDGGFYQTTVASGTPDASTGLFQCRGDVTTAVCQECVSSSSREVLRRCQQQKQAVIWYDSCWIRYQDSSAFNPNPGIVPSTALNNSQTVTEAERFNDLLARAMTTAVDRAANSGTAKKFATDEEKFTSSHTLYSLAQCTADLSVAGCTMCLRSAIGFLPECCSGRRGGSVFLPSCITRYELYPFYNSTTTSTKVPPSGNKVLFIC